MCSSSSCWSGGGGGGGGRGRRIGFCFLLGGGGGGRGRKAGFCSLFGRGGGGGGGGGNGGVAVDSPVGSRSMGAFDGLSSPAGVDVFASEALAAASSQQHSFADVFHNTKSPHSIHSFHHCHRGRRHASDSQKSRPPSVIRAFPPLSVSPVKIVTPADFALHQQLAQQSHQHQHSPQQALDQYQFGPCSSERLDLSLPTVVTNPIHLGHDMPSSSFSLGPAAMMADGSIVGHVVGNDFVGGKLGSLIGCEFHQGVDAEMRGRGVMTMDGVDIGREGNTVMMGGTGKGDSGGEGGIGSTGGYGGDINLTLGANGGRFAGMVGNSVGVKEGVGLSNITPLLASDSTGVHSFHVGGITQFGHAIGPSDIDTSLLNTHSYQPGDTQGKSLGWRRHHEPEGLLKAIVTSYMLKRFLLLLLSLSLILILLCMHYASFPLLVSLPRLN